MVYDAIMGVGRTPQITKDYLTNPYTSFGEDITNLSYISYTLQSGFYLAAGSATFNIINPNFDYVGSSPFTIQRNAGAASTNYIQFDMGKVYTVRGITAYFTIGGQPGETITVYFDTSIDGSTWVNSTSSTGGGEKNPVYGDFNLRYFRFRITNSGSTGDSGVTVLIMRKVQVMLNSLQLNY